MRNILGIGVLVVFLAYACGIITTLIANSTSPGFLFLRAFVSEEGDAARRSLENQLGFQFPASAHNFHRADISGKATWMHFVIDKDDLGGLFRGYMTCEFPLRDNALPTFEFNRLLNGDQRLQLAWWQPAGNDFRSGAGGECTGSDYRLFRLFVDRSQPEDWLVFLEVVVT
jgi:hypothetical protein